MKKIKLLLPLFLFFASHQSSACTTFAISSDTEMTVAKSYDWYAGHGVAFINKNNVEKQALDIGNNYREKAQWTAEFGSLSFSQFGLDLPLGGINDQGLVVEIMWLNQSTYPNQKVLPELNELQWIQYILDTSATTSEAVDQSEKVQVTKYFAPVHYLVCDRSKECASFEYVDGDLVVHENVDVQVLTNSTYDSSFSSLSKYSGFGGSQAIPRDSGSISRFVRAASNISKLPEQDADRSFSSAFDILKSVKSPWSILNRLSTKWQIVYQIESSVVGFKLPHSSKVRYLYPSEQNYDCSSQPLVLDMTGKVTGENDWKFQPFTQDLNMKLLNVGNSSIGSPLSSTEIEIVHDYTKKQRRCIN